MADILPELLSFPPDKQVSTQEYDKQASAYVAKVLALPASTWRIKIDDKSLLEVLSPAVNSIPYMCCLHESLRAAASNHLQAVGCIPWTADFLQQFDAIQVRYAGKQFRELFAAIAEAYLALGFPDLRPLSTAILRLDPSAGTFTANHLTFLRLCLRSGHPSQALAITNKSIHTFPSNTAQSLPEDTYLADEHELSNVYINAKTELSGKISSEIVLEYYLLAAHVYIGLQQYSQAQLALELVILHPSPHGTTSAFQVEAYKKYVLLALLRNGRASTQSLATSPQVTKSIAAIAKPYDTLAETFRTRQWRKFQAEKAVGASIWQQDGNTGLVEAVSSSLLRFCILDLKKTYAALLVSKVAGHLDLPPDQTLKLLQDLVEQGQLDADLVSSQGSTTLRFRQTADAVIVDDAAIEAQTERIQQLMQHVNNASKRLQLTKEFADITRKAKRQGVESDPADQMDLDWTASTKVLREGDDLADEDIME